MLVRVYLYTDPFTYPLLVSTAVSNRTESNRPKPNRANGINHNNIYQVYRSYLIYKSN